MAFKALNNIVGPDNLVPTLFIFGTNLWIVTDLPSSSPKEQRANTLAKAMTKLYELKA